jgi:hypothetical protein
MKALIFTAIFVISFIMQACVTKFFYNYWFPDKTETWLFRLAITLLITIYTFNKIAKKS